MSEQHNTILTTPKRCFNGSAFLSHDGLLFGLFLSFHCFLCYNCIDILQKGNPLNLSSGSGNPIEIMELGYALQLLSLEEIVKNKLLAGGVQNLPEKINQDAARMLLGL